MHWRCTWRTGPDTGAATTLTIGRHVVGRAPRAAVRCDDTALEPHHLLLEVHDDGRLTATQLAGRVPVRSGDGAVVDGESPIASDTALEIGSSTLWCTRSAAVEATTNVRADGAVTRRPRAVPTWQPADLAAPSEPDLHRQPPGGLVPALLGLVGAGVMATVLHQMMFVVFGAMGAFVAVASWATQHAADHRRRAAARSDYANAVAAHTTALQADRAAFAIAHLSATPTTAAARQSADERTGLWERRSAQADAWWVSIGIGPVAWRSGTELSAHLPDMPVPAVLGPDQRVVVAGTGADAVARAWLVQLATTCGPADLRIVVATAHPERWQCFRGLPHLAAPDGTEAVVSHDDLPLVFEQFGDHGHHIVLVTDDADALATRTSSVRRVLTRHQPALLAVLPDDREVPAVCGASLTLQRGPMARWVEDTATTLLPVLVRVAGMSAASTCSVVAALAPLQDPEDTLATGRMPNDVRWAEIMGPIDADAIAAAWTLDAHRSAPRAPIGMAADGVVDIDLVRDGPHGLLAGTTGAGKSELLRTLVAGLAVRNSPAQLQFVLIDYKGGATFDALIGLPHVTGVITDLDAHLADRALRSLHAELRRREAVLREYGAADLATLRKAAPNASLPRLVVVVDEFAALVAEQSAFLHALVGVAQRGRSLGVHLLLATQRPQGVISDDIRANTNLRIALRLQDDADSLDVVGDRIAATLPRGTPGRAVLRLGPDEHVVFQTAHLDEVHTVVDAVRTATELTGLAAGTPPWQPPLPAVLHLHDVEGDPIDHIGHIGHIDDPDQQRRLPLLWRPSDGSVIVIGSPGSGVSSTLRTLAACALAEPDVHVYVITAERRGWSTFADHPAVAVVQLHERERLARLLHRLRAPGDGTIRRTVVLDDLELLRRTVDGVDTPDEHDALQAVLDGVPGDITLAGSATTAALPLGLTSRCPQRWVMHVHDAHEALAFGVAAQQVPAPIPGRAHLAELGLTAQLIHPADVPPPHRSTSPVEPITVVAEHVDASWLPPGCVTADHLLLPVGLDVASGRPWVLPVPDGDHRLVLGGSRSGRSTTLSRLTAAWRAAHPDGALVVVLPRRSNFARHLAGTVLEGGAPCHQSLPTSGPTLLVVDDAELVDDSDGWLSAAIASRRSGLTVMAAARPDALRQRYGHWTLGIRHARLGLVAAGGNDTDGDLLSAVLPRRSPVAPRPGLMWVVQDGSSRLVQVATDAFALDPAAHSAG